MSTWQRSDPWPTELFAGTAMPCADGTLVSPRAAFQDLLMRRAVLVDVQELRAATLATTQAVLLLCEDGTQAGILAASLRAGGHANVWAIRGGRRGWNELGLPLSA